MPKYLPQRFQPDSIQEFQKAAFQRFLDADALNRCGRRSAAIYLYGYSAEMILKSAYFQCQGFSETQPISIHHLRSAIQSQTHSISTRMNLHHLGLWANALVEFRISNPGLDYPDPAFGSLVRSKASAIYQIWRETIRYHKNKAYHYELAKVKQEVEWMLVHADIL